MKIDVIFSTYNGTVTLARMLAAMTRLEYRGELRILGVDNGSTDDTPDILGSFVSRLPLTVLAQPRRGKNRALNTALERMQGDLIVFTDDDVLPAPDWLQRLADCAVAQPQYDVFGGRILPEWPCDPDPLVVECAPLGVTYALTPDDQAPGPMDPGLVWGPNMAVRRRVFDEGHRFRESIGPGPGNYVMGSETEFTLRVARHGYRSWHCDGAVVRHLIRAHQLDPNWVVERAARFGRNQWVQECDHNRAEPWPTLLGVPRWRFASLVREYRRLAAARWRKDPEAAFRARWEISFLQGYLRQALAGTPRKRRLKSEMGP